MRTQGSLGFVLVIVFAEVVPGAVFLYGAYWALAIRRALIGRIYRNHALWLGAVGVLLAVTGFITYGNDPIFVFATSMFESVLFVVIFAFIDSTVIVARRSDPLLRSIIHWERLRLALWGDVGTLAILNLILAVNPTFANGASGQVLENLGFVSLGLIMFISGAAALTVGARRSRDPLLRESLKWLGVFMSLFLAAVLEQAVVSGVFGIGQYDVYYSYPALPGAAIGIGAAYAFYRSARSLAPTNRLKAIAP